MVTRTGTFARAIRADKPLRIVAERNGRRHRRLGSLGEQSVRGTEALGARARSLKRARNRGGSMRGVNLVLGVALFVLAVVGVRTGIPPWLLSLVFLIALGALTTALAPARSMALIRALDLGLGSALVVSWLLAIAASVASWFAWWTFAFGVAFLIVGVGAAGIERESARLSRPSYPSRPSRPSHPRHA
jgi:energy-converting hydrogenase Eha subunit E